MNANIGNMKTPILLEFPKVIVRKKSDVDGCDESCSKGESYGGNTSAPDT